MHHRMRLSASGPECVEAIKAFAAEVTKATTFTLTVSEGRDVTDVDFDDGNPQETSVCVEWFHEQSVEGDLVDQWELDDEVAEGEQDDNAVPEYTIEHYLRTLQALARNAEASRMFLKSRKAGNLTRQVH